MVAMEGTLKIHTENILPIIKKWLYSDKDIFVRELVSNSCDAISKLKILREQKEVDFTDDELRIDLMIDKEKRTLKVIDTGLGMTADEVEKYITQLAFSGAEEFVEKYKGNDQVIGHFGLGFYSAYMVSSKVTIDTLSYQSGSEPAFWSCDGGANYTLEKGSREKRGTEITLHIDEESGEYLEDHRLREILNHYCAFLPYPIYLNGTRVNHKEPLWLKPASECTVQDYRAFYRQLYPLEPEPHFWIHLNINVPFNLKGILYFPKLHRRFDYQKNQIKLFCNRVFVSDNCQDLIPDYLMILRGALDSPDIPLNVSRSSLQMDRTVRSLASHISKKVADRLATLYRTERPNFLENWEEISLVVKLGCMQDDKFYERAKEFLVWKTVDGNWTTIEEYRERHPEGKIFYAQDSHSPFLKLYKEKSIEVLLANGTVDTPLMSFLEGKQSALHFQRIDGGIDPAILKEETALLDAEGRTESSRIAEFVKDALSLEHVEAKSLSSDQLPAFIMVEEDERRLRDYMALSSQDLPAGLADKKTFVVNTNSPLIKATCRLEDKTLAKEILEELHDLSLLSHKELSPDQLPRFIERSTQLLQKLLTSPSQLSAH